MRGLLPRRCGLEALPLPLPHELVILGGAGSGRRVGRKAPGPLRKSIGDSGREPLVDAAASSQRACGERNGNDDGKMADADWHLRGVAIGRRWIASGLTGCVRLPPDVCCDVAQPCLALPSLLLKKVNWACPGEMRYLNTLTLRLLMSSASATNL